jgi:DNA-binding NarL/FixJ family response regulator
MKTVLLIEDNADMRRNITTILEMENYRVIACADGRSGINRARESSPDVILCDIMMPELDGYGVLREVRSDRALENLPFIFLTARGEKRDVRSGMNLGADDYITKPVTATDLLAAIEARMIRVRAGGTREFKPDFSSPKPLEALGLTPREAEVLLWVAQGKSNADIATILETTVHTVKKHLQNIFEKLGLETRNGATVRALEILSNGQPPAVGR